MPRWKKLGAKVGKRLARTAASTATGGMSEQVLQAVQTARPQPQEKVMDYTPMVLAALDDERVQQKLADLVIEIIEAADDPPPQPGGMERFEAQPKPLAFTPPETVTLPFRQRVERHEGKRLVVYLDSKGIPHCGIGHNCSTDNIPDEQQRVGMPISEELCAELFEDDLSDAKHRARRVCSQMGADFDAFPPAVREALHEMHFQLGSAKWRGMFSHLKSGNYPEAAREALRSGLVAGKPSKWFLDTPQRCLNVCHFLSDKTLLFEVGPETAFADGTRGPTVVDHRWTG